MHTAYFSGSTGVCSTPPPPQVDTSLEVTWDQAAKEDVTSYPLVDRQTPVKTLPCPKLHNNNNIFTPVCHSVHRGDVSASVHAGIPHPPEQTPPWEQTPNGSRHPPRADTSQEQTSPGIRHPPRRRHSRDETPLLGADTSPWSRCPLEQNHPPPPGSRLRHTVNEQPVCILLECISCSIIVSMLVKV